LLQGIALQAEGEYLARMGKFKPALQSFERARAFFPPEDRSPDYAFLLKWTGYSQGMLGLSSQAREHFDQAYAILRETALRPEAWLDVFRLRHQAGLLGEQVMRQVAAYPGLAPGFVADLPPELRERHPLLRTPARDIWIDLDADEYRLHERMILGVPLEVRALAYIREAGDWGLPAVRLKNLLWKGEAHAFLQLEGRLQQVLHRLRGLQGVSVRSEEGWVRLEEKSLPKVTVNSGRGQQARPSFLLSRKQFSRSEMQSFYGLSTARACVWIAAWERQGWIRRSGTGPKILYLL
jgi:hypothetical protein